MSRVLLVDDDIELVEMMKEYLQQEGFSVETANDGEAGLQRALGLDDAGLLLALGLGDLDVLHDLGLALALDLLDRHDLLGGRLGLGLDLLVGLLVGDAHRLVLLGGAQADLLLGVLPLHVHGALRVDLATAVARSDAIYPQLMGGPPSCLFYLAPEGVFRAAAVAGGAVGSYPTFSPLPDGCPSGG